MPLLLPGVNSLFPFRTLVSLMTTAPLLQGPALLLQGPHLDLPALLLVTECAEMPHILLLTLGVTRCPSFSADIQADILSGWAQHIFTCLLSSHYNTVIEYP